MTKTFRRSLAGLAAAFAGAAVCVCLVALLQAPLVLGAGAGVLVCTGVFALLVQVEAPTRAFRFTPAPLEFTADQYEPPSDAAQELREALARLRRASP